MFVTYARLEHAQVHHGILASAHCPRDEFGHHCRMQDAIQGLDQSKSFGSGIIKARWALSRCICATLMVALFGGSSGYSTRGWQGRVLAQVRGSPFLFLESQETDCGRPSWVFRPHRSLSRTSHEHLIGLSGLIGGRRCIQICCHLSLGAKRLSALCPPLSGATR